MASRQEEFVLNMLNIQSSLSRVQNGMTIGEIQKQNNWMTRSQVIAILNLLEAISFAYHQVMPHGRTGKKVYRMTEHAAINLASIAREYSEAYK